MEPIKSKKLKKSDLTVTIILIVGILTVANFFSYQLFFRWDLTENDIFSISDASRRTVNELDDIVTIKAYFSSSLPSQLLSLKQEVSDILGEYQTYSNGKVKVEFIDPTGDEALERELSVLGIPQLTFEVYERDKMQLVNGYLGVAISYGDKTEVIPAIKRNTSDLEYQLTTAIKKVISNEIATIGYVATNGTLSLDEAMTAAKASLEDLYTVVNVDLSASEPEIPTAVDTLIIVGPNEQFEEPALMAINDFVKKGGSLLVLADGVRIEQGLMAQKNSTGLESLLKKYGLILNQDLVADTRNGVASFSQGFITFSSNYPFWPMINGDGFSKDNAAVSNLESVILPWASSITIDQSLLAEGAYENLAFTTGKAWHITDNFDISPNSGSGPQGEQKIYDLAVFVNGEIKDAYPEAGSEAAAFSGKIILVSDSEFISDNFLRNTPDNLTFFQNLVDILSFDEDLINIRSKGVTSRPIKEIGDSTKVAVRYFNVLGVTLLVLAFGLGRYMLRRRSRFVDDI